VAKIDYDVLSEGDAVTAASLNDRFDEVRNGLNALESYALAPGALRHNHLPAVAGILATKAVGEKFVTHTYTGAWSWPGTGFAVIAGPSTSLEMVSPTDFTAFRLGMSEASGERWAGVLVHLNVHMVRASDVLEGVETADPVHAVVGVQFKSGGAWYTINRSVRICERRCDGVAVADHQTYQDIAIATMIDNSDLVAAGLAKTATIEGIRGVAAPYESDSGVSGTLTLVLREGRITALRIRASGLTSGA
jgi:hypothetical protein